MAATAADGDGGDDGHPSEPVRCRTGAVAEPWTTRTRVHRDIAVKCGSDCSDAAGAAVSSL